MARMRIQLQPINFAIVVKRARSHTTEQEIHCNPWLKSGRWTILHVDLNDHSMKIKDVVELVMRGGRHA